MGFETFEWGLRGLILEYKRVADTTSHPTQFEPRRNQGLPAAVPAVPTTMSSVIGTPEFRHLLEGLNNDNDRQIMIGIITDREVSIRNRRELSVHSFFSEMILALSHFVFLKTEGFDLAIAGKLSDDLKHAWGPMSSTFDQIRQGQAYDIDREEIFLRMASFVANVRDVFHSFEHLTTDDLEYIDNILDTVVPTSRAIYYATVEVSRFTHMEIMSRSTISVEDMLRASHLLNQHETAVAAEADAQALDDSLRLQCHMT